MISKLTSLVFLYTYGNSHPSNINKTCTIKKLVFVDSDIKTVSMKLLSYKIVTFNNCYYIMNITMLIHSIISDTDAVLIQTTFFDN